MGTTIGLMQHITPSFRLAASLAVVAVLAGCASPTHRAPVEERTSISAQPQRLPPGAENAGKPGYYTVKPGDTLIRIGLETGQSWRDIAGWNNIENPDRIEVGQVVRIVAPVGESAPVATAAAVASSGVIPAAKPVTTARIEPRPVGGKPVSAASAPAVAASGSSAAVAASTPEVKPEVKPAGEPTWAWPANGPTIAQFEEGKRKGLVIGGKAGDPVVAAGDGRVVYAGSGLRGYGNLVIIKHGEDYLTAYAHNQALLVKEDQTVRRGQKIAEMGATDADRVQLHFEIRKQGKPIDPARQLPAR